MKIEITKERVLEAASKCETAKQTLKTLFPEVFKEEEYWMINFTYPEQLFFQNNITKKTFFIGDQVTLSNPNHSFGDGVRDHVISGFYLPDRTITGIKYTKVYALFEGYTMERAVPLEGITLIKRCK